MLIRDFMTRDVVTVPSSMALGEARKLMKERNISRLPVVDKGKLMGVVNKNRLEMVAHERSHAPVPWQMVYLMSHTTVGDVMVKDVATVGEDATVEKALMVARKYEVGGIVVLGKEEQVVGIVTTTDMFNGVVARLLGTDQPGARITVRDIGPAASLGKIINIIADKGVKILNIFTNRPPVTPSRQDAIIHLDVEDAGPVLKALTDAGFHADIRAR